MNTAKAIDAVLQTLDELHRDLTAAQHGPMEPRLRSELSRLAQKTSQSAVQLAAANLTALGQISAKKEAIAALAAANKAAIAEKQAAAKQNPVTAPLDDPATPPIDANLGQQLADELLKRQPNRSIPQPPKHSQGVLDSWDWRRIELPILQ